MNDPQLLVLVNGLKVLGIPVSYYSLGRQRDERMCLVFSGGKWLV